MSIIYGVYKYTFIISVHVDLKSANDFETDGVELHFDQLIGQM